jgi:hypothetical protein
LCTDCFGYWIAIREGSTAHDLRTNIVERIRVVHNGVVPLIADGSRMG